MESSHQTTLSIVDFFFWKLLSLGQSIDDVLFQDKFQDKGLYVYKRKQIDMYTLLKLTWAPAFNIKSFSEQPFNIKSFSKTNWFYLNPSMINWIIFFRVHS